MEKMWGFITNKIQNQLKNPKKPDFFCLIIFPEMG